MVILYLAVWCGHYVSYSHISVECHSIL